MGFLDGLRKRDFVPPERAGLAGGAGASAAARPAGPTSVAASKPVALPRPPAGLEQHVAYSRTPRKPFGEIAIALGLLQKAQLDRLLAAQRGLAASKGRTYSLGQLALRAKLLDEQQIQQILDEQAFVVHVDARQFGSSPFQTWLEDLHRIGITPKVMRVSPQELADARQASAGDDDVDLATLTLARRLLTDAAFMDASDVHIHLREHHTEIQIRVLGDLRSVTNASYSMGRAEGEALIRATLAGLATVRATYHPLEFQDAQIAGDQLPDTGLTSVRLVRGPSFPKEAGGGFMVARLQYRRDRPATRAGRRMETRTPARPPGKLELGSMGWTPLQIDLLGRILRLSTGIVIVGGPTGSGKTTSMNEAMREQSRLFPGARQITIEQPPEIPMPEAIQLEAEKGGFGVMVERILRMDPDILLVGELRALEEVSAAMQAAMTGHFVWATVHSRDPYKIPERLEGLDPDRLTLSKLCDHELIVAMIGQRIVSELCPHCSRPLERASEQYMPRYIRNALQTWGDISLARVRGDERDTEQCPHCHGLGTIRRRAVAEIVIPDEKFMRLYRTKGVLEARRYMRAKPGSDKSMLANAIDLVLAGTVDPMDVHRGVLEIHAMGDDFLHEEPERVDTISKHMSEESIR